MPQNLHFWGAATLFLDHACSQIRHTCTQTGRSSWLWSIDQTVLMQ